MELGLKVLTLINKNFLFYIVIVTFIKIMKINNKIKI